MNFFSDSFAVTVLSALGRASLQGGIAIAAVALLERMLPTLPEVWRSRLWRLVFVKLALSLFISAGVPLPILPGAKAIAAAPAAESRTVVAENISTSAPATLRTPPAFSSAAILAALWAGGTCVALTLQFRAGCKVRTALRQSQPLANHEFQRALDAAAVRLGVRRIPEIRVISAAGGPRLIGVLRPLILAPRDWLETCSATQLRLAAAHELAHVLRRDLLWNHLVAICQAVFFFHPLVWRAGGRYLLAQELACDALALERVEPAPEAFARMLLQLATTPAGSAWDGSAAMTGASLTLRERILAMDRWQLARRPSRVVGCAVTLAVAAGMVPFVVAQQSSVKSPSEESAPAVKKSTSDKTQRASASASASAGGFGGAIGIGAGGGQAGGNGGEGRGAAGGVARARASVRASASVGDGGTTAPKTSASDSPNDIPRSSTAKKSQRMSSQSDSDGEKWSRKTEVTEGGREIRIEESNDRIRVTTKEGGAENVVEAKDAAELQTKSPAAFETLRKFVKEGKPAAIAIPAAGLPGGAFPNGALPAGGLPGGFPNGALPAEAQGFFKQFRESVDAAGIQDPAIGKLLDDLQNQLQAEE